MKIVLVQPRIGYMDALRSAPSLPLGLLMVAAALAERYEVEVIDARVCHDVGARLQAALQTSPLYVGVTCHTGPMIDSALRISRLVKAHGDVPVVWGGVHASLAPEQTVAHPDVDICVIGEGEQTALELAMALESGAPLGAVSGLVYKHEGQPRRTPPRALLAAAAWPEPAYDAIDLRDYLSDYAGRSTLSFQASRGCVCRCSYCYNEQFNRRRWRRLPAKTVLARIAHLRQQVAFGEVYLVDDNFFVTPKWALEIAEGIASLGLTWQCQGAEVSSLLRLDDDQIDRLRRSGLRRLSLGVESGSDRVRRQIGKRGTTADVERAVGRLADAGIRVYASFMVGFPGETTAEMRDTVELALRLTEGRRLVHCSPFYCYTPLPGTRAYDEAVALGFHPPQTVDEWARAGGFDDYTWLHSTTRAPLGRDTFESLNMATLLMDRKVQDYSASSLVKALATLYRPIARARARHLYFRFMPERWLLRALYRRLSGHD